MLGNFGIVHRSLGDVETAVRYGTHAREIAKELGDPKDEALWLSFLANLRLADDPEAAVGIAHEAGELARRSGSAEIEAEVLATLAQAQWRLGRVDEARASLQAARAAAPEGNTETSFAIDLAAEQIGDGVPGPPGSGHQR